MSKHIAFITVIVILAGGAYATQKWFAEKVLPASEATATENLEQAVEGTTSYVIPVRSEGTVLDAMEIFASSTNFAFSGRDFAGLGFFVEEIGGLPNAYGFYWTLFINDVLSEEGVSSAHVVPTDVVEWRYQKGV